MFSWHAQTSQVAPAPAPVAASFICLFIESGANRKNYVDESSVNGIYFIVTYVNCYLCHTNSRTHRASILTSSRLNSIWFHFPPNCFFFTVMLVEYLWMLRTLMHGLRMSLLFVLLMTLHSSFSQLILQAELCRISCSTSLTWFIAEHSKIEERGLFLIHSNDIDHTVLHECGLFPNRTCPGKQFPLCDINHNFMSDKCFLPRTQLLIENVYRAQWGQSTF